MPAVRRPRPRAAARSSGLRSAIRPAPVSVTPNRMMSASSGSPRYLMPGPVAGRRRRDAVVLPAAAPYATTAGGSPGAAPPARCAARCGSRRRTRPSRRGSHRRRSPGPGRRASAGRATPRTGPRTVPVSHGAVVLRAGQVRPAAEPRQGPTGPGRRRSPGCEAQSGVAGGGGRPPASRPAPAGLVPGPLAARGAAAGRAGHRPVPARPPGRPPHRPAVPGHPRRPPWPGPVPGSP